MKIPGVADLVGTLTGGAALALQAGVRLRAGAAGAVQILASPVTELVGPVVQTVAHTTGRVIGPGGPTDGASETSASGALAERATGAPGPRSACCRFPRWHEYAPVIEEPVRRIAGVAKAHVEGSLGRLVVEIAEDADDDAVLDEVRETAAAAAADSPLA